MLEDREPFAVELSAQIKRSEFYCVTTNVCGWMKEILGRKDQACEVSYCQNLFAFKIQVADFSLEVSVGNTPAISFRKIPMNHRTPLKVFLQHIPAFAPLSICIKGLLRNH